MRYQVFINLLALKNLGSKITLDEAVLLDYLYWLCSSPSLEVEKLRLEKDGKRFTWFDYGYYIKETPILRGKTKATITPKLKKLEDEGFIETMIKDGDDGGGRKFVSLLPKIDGLFRKLNDPVKITKRPPFRKLNIDNNTNYDNNTNDNELAILKKIADKKEIDSLINKFKEINPSYKKFFANKTQRSALDRLVRQFGAEQIGRVIDSLPAIQGVPYAPTITTPIQLEDKLAALKNFIQKEQLKNNKSFIMSIKDFKEQKI